MRIENVGITQNITDKTPAGTLSQGDVLIAQVAAVDGDTVSLKSQDGLSLTARLLTDIGVRVGDFVETVVDEAGRGRYVLRIVDITRGSGGEEPLLQDGFGAASAGAAARALLGTMAMLKMNPSVDPKAAVFLSQHGLSGTPENLETLSQIVKDGETIGKLLAQVAGGETLTENLQQAPGLLKIGLQKAAAQMAEPETQQTQIAQTVPQADQQQNAKNDVQSNAPMNQEGAQQAQPGEAAAGAQTKTNYVPINQGSQHADAGAEAAAKADKPTVAPPESGNTNAQAVSDKTVNAANTSNQEPIINAPQASKAPPTTSQPSTQANTDLSEAAKTGDTLPAQVLGTHKAPNAAATLKQGDFESVAQRAVSLFIKLSDKDDVAAHIKKAINELPEQLKELKLLMERTDTMNKGRFEPAEKQAELLSQIKRFDCFHIPLMMPDNKPATAELYVYRHRNKKAAQDGENMVILLGLDTQHMGRVETLVKAGGNSLGIELFLEDMRLAEEVESDADGLRQAAQKLGYLQTTVSIKKLAARTTLLTAEKRLTAGENGSAGSVDIRI